ncbi:hypothetical protein TrVFT333_007625 [Trichoderma virens FT-333]|nr:hypothetical protein TrVFT333_007625 [Trichoderma virens FT-333]
MMNKIIVGALGLVASVAATPLELAERSSCRDDSLYKCFADREYSHSASAYCSALTPVTQTVSVTKPRVTKTVWVTSTAPASTDFISSTTTVYTATVPSSTETATSTATETVTTTITVTGAQQPPQTQAPPPPITTTMIPEKRIVQGGKPQPPKCMLTKCFVYSPERITAGCSCIGVPPKTVTVSQTAPCSTITVTSTSTTTPQVTATAWQTVVTELANGVSTTTTTVTATATTTTIVTATPPAQNLIPNGDFSSGVTGWTVINTSPASWINAGVTTNNSPDGTSKSFQVTNVIANGQFFLASPMFGLKPFEPTLSDVLVVRAMLSQSVILPELVATILDYAEYWARSSTRAHVDLSIRAKQVGNGEFDFQGSRFLLRSYPVGLTENAVEDEDTGNERPGPFIAAKTWFEAGIERFNAGHECEQCQDIRQLPLCKLAAVEPRPESTVSRSGVTEYRYEHSPWKGPREILRNKMASSEWTDYEVTWTCWDVVAPNSKEAQQAMEEGKGKMDGDGQFVRSLKLGDVITVWGRAMHRGWVNVVDTVEMDVYWAL